jgi:hypothetical protein
MKSKLLFFFLLLGFGSLALGQDILTLKSGKEIRAVIVEEGSAIVKYREFDNPTGPLYSVNKENVSSIKYEKGAKALRDTKVGDTEKPFAVAPVQNNKSGLLTVKKKYVYLDGVAQSPRGVSLLMEDQPEALRLYESGTKLCRLSNSCAYGVMITSIVFSQIVNKKKTSEEKIRTGIPGLVIDGGFIIAAIIMASKGKSNIRKSVSLYNSSVVKPVSYKLDFGLQENGIGLALKF